MAKRKSYGLGALVLVVLVGIVGVVALGSATKSCINSDTEFNLPSGSSYEALTDTLEAHGVERMGVVNLVARLKKLDQSVKGGHYEFRRGTSPMSLVNALRAGAQKPVRLTFNNIRTLDQLAGRLAEQIEADSLTLLAHLTAPATAQKYGFTREEFIGMFIPNTYQVWWTLSPEALTDRMAKEYDKFWTSERTAALARTRLSKKEVINLASIVYEETKVVSEMPKIAGVYINRLRRGMPLQACPTAKYAVGDFTLKRILYKHTQVESPYNTYKHRGLPPGPICMPSIAAIDAVLGYADHKWLYFCAKEDLSGRHNFASTLAEHNRNSRRYNEALKRNSK